MGLSRIQAVPRVHVIRPSSQILADDIGTRLSFNYGSTAVREIGARCRIKSNGSMSATPWLVARTQPDL